MSSRLSVCLAGWIARYLLKESADWLKTWRIVIFSPTIVQSRQSFPDNDREGQKEFRKSYSHGDGWEQSNLVW